VFSGKPRPALDKAWHDLLNGTPSPRDDRNDNGTDLEKAENIRLEPEVMKRLGREDIGVRIPGEDGYIGTLNVYHELHCLVRLAQLCTTTVAVKILTTCPKNRNASTSTCTRTTTTPASAPQTRR